MDTPSRPVSIEVAGQKYTGEWTVSGGEISVVSPHGSRTIPLGRAHPDALARRALREIVVEQTG